MHHPPRVVTLARMQSIDQVALVVRDLDASMRHSADALGIRSWEVHTFGPDWCPRMTFRGREQPYSMRMAFGQVGATQYELIQPLDGPTLYHEFLETQGEGLHHLGYVVDDLEVEVAAMEAKGFAVIQSGWGYGVDGDGGYAYFDTEAALGCIVEGIERPRALPAPEAVVTCPPS